MPQSLYCVQTENAFARFVDFLINSCPMPRRVKRLSASRVKGFKVHFGENSMWKPHNTTIHWDCCIMVRWRSRSCWNMVTTRVPFRYHCTRWLSLAQQVKQQNFNMSQHAVPQVCAQNKIWTVYTMCGYHTCLFLSYVWVDKYVQPFEALVI